MAEDTTRVETEREPRGFGEHTRGLSGEYAHEQGWGLNEGERTYQSGKPQDVDGGTDYEYGARDFGDTPVNVAIDHDEPVADSNTDALRSPLQTTGKANS